jgi:DNA-binding MarR family transcriptional regulator
MRLSAADFADKISEVMPSIMREFSRRQASELMKGKVTLTQMLILEFLERKGAVKMTDIARFMQVSTAAATGIVERLVKAGYVIRTFQENDRRIIRIKINSRGLDLVRRVAMERHKVLSSIFSSVSDKDRIDYLRILTKINDNLIKEAVKSDEG